ncbi:MAG: hypothetical protein ACXWUZ_03895 [Allosphingosinicella sp.]
MEKTPVAARFLQRLIEVGDQICFSAFRQWEFDRALASLATQQADEFTPTVFTANPYSRKINRRIADLPSFSKDAEQTALRMSVIASVEHVLAYLDEIQAFRAMLSATEADQLTHDAEEEQLRLKIEAWSGIKPVAGCFLTLGLLRVLRNHYAHLNASPHQALKAYVSAHGTPLNRFWAKTPLDLHGLDFKTIATAPITFELGIAIINLLRVSMMNIDSMVAQTLGFEDAAAWLLCEALKHPRSGAASVDRLTSKVRQRLRMEFGHSCRADAIRPMVERLCGG